MYTYAYRINRHTYTYFIPHMAWKLQIMYKFGCFSKHILLIDYFIP